MGKVVATYLIRLTLRKRDDLLPPDQAKPGTFHSESDPPTPTLAEVEREVKDALYASLPYYTADEIGVAAERVDE
jgi:hypothetical protein